MADKIEVHFTSNGKELRAVADPANTIKAVLILPKGPASGMGLTRSSFAQAHELILKDPGVPPGLKVKKKESEDIVTLDGSEPGPGVCYWVGEELVCW